MKKSIIALLIPLLLNSCASILNSHFTTTIIHTTQPSKIVYKKDTINTIKNRVFLGLERQKKLVEIIAITDSLTKKVTINSRNSAAYYLNIPYTYGLGLLIEKNNPKRYTYPHNIYLNSADSANKYSRYTPVSNNAGQLLLHLSLPHINSFLLMPAKEQPKINIGFWGLSVGLDYFHSKNQYVNLSYSGVTDFFLPFPAAVDIEGDMEEMSSTYWSLSNNHKIKRFSIGYGLAYATNYWRYNRGEYWTNTSSPGRKSIKKSNNALGLVFSSYFQATPHFYLGVIYRPTFIRPSITPTIRYEHLISIDFAWKIHLKK